LPLLRQSGLDVTEYCPPFGGRTFRPGVLAKVRGRYAAPIFGAEMLALLLQRVPGIIGSRAADVTWLERSFVPVLDDTAASLGRPIVLDLDDAIWLYNPLGRATVGRLVSRATTVVAGNSYIADWCGSFCSDVRIVPTAIDTQVFKPGPSSPHDEFVIGWTGTSGNFSCLSMIEESLRTVLERVPSSKLVVVADRRPHLPKIPAEALDFRQWSPAIEHEAVQQMDVGIMPLEDTDIARGKCSFKMLQYMSCAVPVVVSPVGMNAQVLALGAVGFAANSGSQWVEALEFYSANPALRREHGLCGRAIVERDFDSAVVGARLARLFAEFA
jgi:glycosyltransferase involved in cell wall biosynthesis